MADGGQGGNASGKGASGKGGQGGSSIDALRAAQEQALAGMGEAWKLLGNALSGVPLPGNRDMGQQLHNVLVALTQAAASTTAPLQKLVDSQHDLADLLERWGQMQGEMAQLTQTVARQQRFVADVLAQALMPFQGHNPGADKAKDKGKDKND